MCSILYYTHWPHRALSVVYFHDSSRSPTSMRPHAYKHALHTLARTKNILTVLAIVFCVPYNLDSRLLDWDYSLQGKVGNVRAVGKAQLIGDLEHICVIQQEKRKMWSTVYDFHTIHWFEVRKHWNRGTSMYMLRFSFRGRLDKVVPHTVMVFVGPCTLFAQDAPDSIRPTLSFKIMTFMM